jgi:PPP family 3-phenylpropionic acid transporter
MLARMATGPALAIWADGFQLRRTAILIMSGLSALGYGMLLVTSGFWPWMVAWFIGVTGYWVCSPLVDVVTLRRGAREGFAYATPRGVGSAAYVVANIVAGVLIPVVGPVLAPAWVTVAALLSVAGAVTLIPPDRVHEDGATPQTGRGRLAGAGRLLRDPIFMLMLFSAAFVQAAHGFYYAFSTLVWRAQGISPAWSGILWGVGVAVEVGFLWFGEGLRRRMGPERLLLFGADRWCAGRRWPSRRRSGCCFRSRRCTRSALPPPSSLRWS